MYMKINLSTKVNEVYSIGNEFRMILGWLLQLDNLYHLKLDDTFHNCP